MCKLREIKNILKDYNINGLKEAGIDIDVVEDGETFYDNALKKAKEIYEIAKVPVIADDSGLCVCSLNDWPGVYSHRFNGNDSTPAERNAEIIRRTSDADPVYRKAKVVCCLVYYDGKDIVSSIGEINGKITEFERGANGFGFDTIFELESGYTMAEISPEEKNSISARGVACKKLLLKLKELNK